MLYFRSNAALWLKSAFLFSTSAQSSWTSANDVIQGVAKLNGSRQPEAYSVLAVREVHVELQAI